MPRSRKRKLPFKCLNLIANDGLKSSANAGAVRIQGDGTTARRLLSASIAALLATPAVAQTVDNSAEMSRPLDAIIVTATKRAENIQDVPVTILALDRTLL